MNRTALTLAAAITASLLSTTALAQGKVGVINLTKVFDEFWRTKQADIQIKDRISELEKMGQSMYDDYKKANEEFGKQIEAANDPPSPRKSPRSAARIWIRSARTSWRWKTTSSNSRATASAP